MNTVSLVSSAVCITFVLGCSGTGDALRTSEGPSLLHTVEPVAIRLGAAQGAEVEQFYQIRSVVHMKDGRIVVADGGSNEIRFFDADGRHVRTVGGDGAGPGEFKNLRWLRRTPTDTLVAWDGQLMRVVVFDSAGNAVRSFPIATDPEFFLSIPESIYPDGSILSLAGPPVEEADSIGNGYWSIVALHRTGPTGEDLGRVALVKQQRCLEPGCARRVNAFRSVWAPAADGVYYHEAGSNAIQTLDQTGEPEGRFILTDVPTASDTAAAFEQMQVDSEGRIWLHATSGSWHAFSSAGSHNFEVRVPASLDVHVITSEYVLGVTRDDAGVEYVELLELTSAQ